MLVATALSVSMPHVETQLLGWTDSTAGAVGSGVLAPGASAALIWIHHPGYREFPGSREILLPILACVLSLATC